MSLELRSDVPLDGQPLTPVLDFAALLEAVEDPSELAADSLRVVAVHEEQTLVWPGQFLDDRVDLMAKGPSQDPVGDHIGAVAFVPDSLASGSADVWLYFGSATHPAGAALEPPVPAEAADGTRLQTGAMTRRAMRTATSTGPLRAGPSCGCACTM